MLPNQRSQIFVPKFSLDKCLLIALAFSSGFHSEFGSTCGVGQGFNLFTPFFCKTVFFPPFKGFDILSENQLAKM